MTSSDKDYWSALQALELECPKCLLGFNKTEWDNRHSINAQDAYDHELVEGEYHDGCCTLCALDI